MMEKQIWFKRKKYGWGWVPANSKGWMAVAFYAFLLAVYPMQKIITSEEFNVLYFVIYAIVLTFGFIAFCAKKGEKPKWQWGNK